MKRNSSTETDSFNLCIDVGNRKHYKNISKQQFFFHEYLVCYIILTTLDLIFIANNI
jgi:hypothetical protein